MGYDLHITRAHDRWDSNEGQQIGEAEWLAVVDADPELRLATPADPYYCPGMVLWTGQTFEGYAGPWFAWLGGKIYSKNPNGPIIEKMIALAHKLDARVLGDESEEYLADGTVIGWERTPFVGPDWRSR